MAGGISPFAVESCKTCSVRYDCPMHMLTMEYCYKELSIPRYKFVDMSIFEQLVRLEFIIGLSSVTNNQCAGRCIDLITSNNSAGLFKGTKIKFYKPDFKAFFKKPFINGDLWHKE